jgi:hypothetical protein
MLRSYWAVAALAAFVLGASPASADRIAPGYKISWGKAGVSLEDYWVDAAQCGHAAAAIDLKDTTPAKALVYGSRLLDDASSPGEVMSVQQLVAPEIQWNRAATIMRKALEMCLAERGYVRFRLTDSQFRHLRKLEAGSVERRQFLHRLASDAVVLARKAVDRS